MDSQTINVCFITDETYAMPTIVSITSLYINKNKNKKYQVYLIYTDLKDKTIKKFEKLSKKNFELSLIKANTNKYEMVKSLNHVTTSALLKFDIPNILSSIDKAIYIDGDTIVNDDLSNLFSTNIENHYLGAIKDIKIELQHGMSAKMGVNSYFNSGVMLLNLKLMREENVTEKLIEAKIYQPPSWKFMDQDSFNHICNNKVVYLDPKYNLVVNMFLNNDINTINNFYHTTYKSIKDMLKKSAIIHIAGTSKPWLDENNLYTKLWDSYYKKSILKNEKLKRVGQNKKLFGKVKKENGYDYYFIGLKVIKVTKQKFKKTSKILGIKFTKKLDKELIKLNLLIEEQANQISIIKQNLYKIEDHLTKELNYSRNSQSKSMVALYKILEYNFNKILPKEKYRELQKHLYAEKTMFHQINFVNRLKLDEELKNFNEMGISSNKKSSPRLIVSLTSYPDRMHDISYALYSLLNQTLKPEMVILWLGIEQFPNKEKDIPIEVLNLQKNGLTIKWTPNLRSYTKLIPSLIEYPEDIIVTADDDIYYPQDWLEGLYNAYLEHPNYITAARTHKIAIEENKILPYNIWLHETKSFPASYQNFLTGVGGVLYPPHCLYKDTTNEKLFKKLSPLADDIWFWAMAVKAGTKINCTMSDIPLTYTNPEREARMTDETTLGKSNVVGSQNNVQLENVFNHYKDLENKVIED